MAKTILIVEDNAIQAQLIKDVLEHKGFKTVCASDGVVAQIMVLEHRPDLVLMDIQLPGISGLEVTKFIRADATLKETPVVAVTAFASKSEAENIRAAGCDNILTKPFAVSDLREIVVRYIGEAV